MTNYYMRKKVKNLKVKGMLIVLGLCLVNGCLHQEDMFRTPVPEDQNQWVTPIRKLSISVAPGGISTTSDGSLFGVTGDFGVNVHKKIRF